MILFANGHNQVDMTSHRLPSFMNAIGSTPRMDFSRNILHEQEAPMRMLVPPGQHSTNPNLHQAGTTE